MKQCFIQRHSFWPTCILWQCFVEIWAFGWSSSASTQCRPECVRGKESERPRRRHITCCRQGRHLSGTCRWAKLKLQYHLSVIFVMAFASTLLYFLLSPAGQWNSDRLWEYVLCSIALLKVKNSIVALCTITFYYIISFWSLSNEEPKIMFVTKESLGVINFPVMSFVPWQATHTTHKQHTHNTHRHTGWYTLYQCVESIEAASLSVLSSPSWVT